MSINAIDQPGRSHIQRDLKHLVRDVRQEVKAEVKELRAAGEGSEAKIASVRSAYFDFRDQVQSAFQDAGRGSSFDAAAVPEALRQAMIAFTETLKGVNGTTDAPVETPVETPTTDRGATDLPALSLEPGTLFDVTA